MEHLTSFWAGAMDHGDGLDLSAVAEAAGGWNLLEAGGADALIAAGVPVERARWWMATPPRQTCGKVVTMADARYPEQLRRMRQPPPVLLVDGDPDVLSMPAVAVVGTREATSYGRAIARQLGARLAEAGVLVVSGLARGIDTEVHRGAAEGGRTVAFLGHGLDYTAPSSNRWLRRHLIERGGAVVSTFPDALPARPHTFPIRNQWIAGLSHWCVVVEAADRSGALITARLALAEGREVAAVPGPIGAPASVGCLGLIRDGAHVVLDVPSFVAQVTGATERRAEDWLEDVYRGTPIDEVARRHGRSTVELIRQLATLEVQGVVVRASAHGYSPSGRQA